jgi:hypothetical protein
MPPHPFLHRGRRPVALAATAALLGTSAAYAVGVIGGPAEAPRAANDPIVLIDDDGGRAMFTMLNMGPGATAQSCIAVTNGSPVPVDVALHARRAGDIDPHIRLDVDRGTGKAAGSSACDGFAAGERVWTGPLDSFPAPGDAGVRDGTMAAGATRVYRYTATLSTDDAAQGRASDVTFTFIGTGEPPVPTPTPTASPAATPTPVAPADVPVEIPTAPGETCSTYYLGSTVKRTVKVAVRVRAQIEVTQVGRGTAQERLRFAVKLTNLKGKVLTVKGYANVTFKRNGKTIARTKKRPFVVLMKTSAFRTGRNKVSVEIRNRHGKRTRGTFVLNLGKALLDQQTVCVIKKETR